MEYKTKLAQALWGLYQQWDKELGETPSIWGMFYKMFRHQIPEVLNRVDEDEELQVKIKGFIQKLTETIKEEVKE